MQNFTEEIKNEIISLPPNDDNTRIAMLSAFIRTSGSVVSLNGIFGFEIVTENSMTADFFISLIENGLKLTVNVAEARFDALSGKEKLVFNVEGNKADDITKKMFLTGKDKEGNYLNLGIDDRLVSKPKYKLAYIKGAFLGGGSCTLPEEGIYSRTGYHLEFVFSNKITADDFCSLLCELDILAKLVNRKDSYVVYIKSMSVISDILNALQCYECLEKLNKIVERKYIQNNENRVNNCTVSNIDKTLTASVNQVQAIEIISRTIGLQSLDKPLFDVAECRLADKNASMQELSERLNITKSCINHRMRKIFEIAKTLKD